MNKFDAPLFQLYSFFYSKFREKIYKSFDSVFPQIKIDSQCKYALVARGDADLYIRYSGEKYKENIWDHMAGYMVVKEAGGVVVDVTGKELDFSKGKKLLENSGIICANKKIVPKAIQAANKVHNKL